MQMLLVLGLLLVPQGVEAGLPVDRLTLLTTLYGQPCDFGGGTQSTPLSQYTQSVDCGDKNAFLQYFSSPTGGTSQHWKCVNKPKPLPPLSDGQCPSNCSFVDQMRASCYSSLSTCLKDRQPYFWALPSKMLQSTGVGGWIGFATPR